MIRLKTLSWLLLPLLMAVGCKNDKNVVTSTTVLLVGDVVNHRTQRGIPNVSISTIQYTETTRSDSSGHYQLEVTTGDSFRGIISVVAIISGYSSDTTNVNAVAGHQVLVPKIVLNNLSDSPDTTVGGPSGPPATLLYVGATDTSIGVRETGIPETAILTYEVRDTRGIPVDLNNRCVVKFVIQGQTGGGEYLGNDTAVTNENGRVQVSIISGIRPGTIQIVASVHDTIIARPVRMSIHTGPPDQLHTTIGYYRVNFPGLDWVGRVDSVVALIGDRYSNPVPAGTQSYFSTNNGVIQPQGVANFDGMTVVPLFSGNPYPWGVNADSSEWGFSTCRAQTVDWLHQSYIMPGRVLWTGAPANFSIQADTFNIENGGSRTFHVHVSDEFDHPFSEGTVFAVGTTSGNLSGDVNVTYPDTWSRAWTNFVFSLSDADTTYRLVNVSVTCSVNGLNGYASLTITGTMR